MWATKVSQESKLFLKENILQACLKNFKTSSSFIQPFEDDATTHRFLTSSISAVASLLAPWKTIWGFNFVPFAFAVNHILTLTFSLPVDLRGTSFVPVVLTVTFPTIWDQSAVSSIAIIQSGEEFVFMDSLRTCVTYLTNLVIRWERCFCAIVVCLHIEGLFRFMNFVSQPLLATNPAFSSSLSPQFSSQINLTLNMITFLEIRIIFERRCCIQLRSSSKSTCVSFHPPPSSLNLPLFMDVTFSSFWTHSRTVFGRHWIYLLNYG